MSIEDITLDVERSQRLEQIQAVRSLQSILSAAPVGEEGRAVDSVTLSEGARHVERIVLREEITEPLDPMADARTTLLALLMRSFGGLELELRDPVDEPDEGGEGAVVALSFDAVVRAGQSTTFRAEALLETEDGEAVPVRLAVTVAEELLAAAEELVVPREEPGSGEPAFVALFRGPAEALTERHFHFAVDADGHDDQVLAPAGSEEAPGPALLERVRVWSLGADGSRQLIGLGSASGALYVGDVTEPMGVVG